MRTVHHVGGKRPKIGTEWWDQATPPEALERMAQREPRALMNPKMPLERLAQWAPDFPEYVESNPILPIFALQSPDDYEALERELSNGWVDILSDPDYPGEIARIPSKEAARLRIAFVRHVLPLYEDNMVGRRARTAPRKLLEAFERYLENPDNPFRQRDLDDATRRAQAANAPEDGRLAATRSVGGYDYDTAQHSVLLAALHATQDDTETAAEAMGAVFLNADLYGDPTSGLQALNEALYQDQLRGIQTALPEGEFARRAQLDLDYARAQANAESEWQADQVRAVYFRVTTQRLTEELLAQLRKNWKDVKRAAAIQSGIERANASALQIAGIMADNAGGFATWPRWLGLGLVVGGTITALVIAPQIVLALGIGEEMIGVGAAVDSVALTIEEAAAQTGIKAVTLGQLSRAVKLGTVLQSDDLSAFIEELTAKLAKRGFEILENIPEAIAAR